MEGSSEDVLPGLIAETGGMQNRRKPSSKSSRLADLI